MKLRQATMLMLLGPKSDGSISLRRRARLVFDTHEFAALRGVHPGI